MKLKISELLNMKPVIEKLIKLDVPVMVAYDLTKVVKAVSDELEIYSAMRVKLFDKFGVESEDKKGKVVPAEKVEEFKAEMEKLINKEIKLECPKIKLSALGDVKLSTADLMILNLITEK